MACVFDVPEEHMEGVKEVCESEDWLEVCTELPTLKVRRPTLRGLTGEGPSLRKPAFLGCSSWRAWCPCWCK